MDRILATGTVDVTGMDGIRHTEECLLVAALTGEPRCLDECALLRGAHPLHRALRHAPSDLVRAAAEHRTPYSFTTGSGLPNRHTAECVLYATETRQAFCVAECADLRRQDPADPALRYTDQQLRQAASYQPPPPAAPAPAAPIQATCPGCYRALEITEPLDTGLRCPHCNLGIPLDALPRSARKE